MTEADLILYYLLTDRNLSDTEVYQAIEDWRNDLFVISTSLDRKILYIQLTEKGVNLNELKRMPTASNAMN